MSQHHRLFKYYFPLAVWMLLIFSLSTNTGSSENTNPVIQKMLLMIFPGADKYLNPQQIHSVDVFIRKSAHVTEYAILSILAFRAFRCGRERFTNSLVYGTFLFCFIYAATDEFHQRYYSSRGASVADVFIDAGGILLGLCLCLWLTCHNLQRKIHQI